MLEHELDEPVGHRRLGDTVGLEPAHLAGHARNVEPRSPGHDGFIGVSQRSRAKTGQVVEDRLAQ